MSRPLHFPLRAEDFRPPADLDRVRGTALGVGVLAAIATGAGAFLDADQFYRSYLVGWMLWYMVAGGCVGLMMLHHLSGGLWGFPVRRAMEAAGRTLPFMLLLAVPMFFGLEKLFAWADPKQLAIDPVLKHRELFYNPTAFVGRTIAILALFSFFAFWLSRRSVAQDRSGDPAIGLSMSRFSAVGLLVWVIVSSVFAFDWLMGLDPHWSSSLFGGIFVSGSALAALAFLILVSRFLSLREPMDSVFMKKSFHDYGKLMFAFVMFFTYLQISQFIITYQGNLPEEVHWFNLRLHGTWGWVGAGLLIFHFFFPFLILLSRDVKTRRKALAAIAAFVLFMRWIDLNWEALPNFEPKGVAFHWLDLAAPLAVGGLWIAYFVTELKKESLLPVGDRELTEVLAHD